MIRLFIGTDTHQAVAERALEASVRKNTTLPVDITWMRAGTDQWPNGLELGWKTPFTLFRFWVPGLCEYAGRAIYMDVDMLALADLKELWEWPIPPNKPCASTQRPDVIVWNCAHVSDVPRDYDAFDWVCRNSVRLPPEWDHRDRLRKDTKILHFTRLRTQFWKPYPDRYPYDEPHQDQAAQRLFWAYAGQPQPA